MLTATIKSTICNSDSLVNPPYLGLYPPAGIGIFGFPGGQLSLFATLMTSITPFARYHDLSIQPNQPCHSISSRWSLLSDVLEEVVVDLDLLSELQELLGLHCTDHITGNGLCGSSGAGSTGFVNWLGFWALGWTLESGVG